MQQRRGTATQWTTANPILNVAEIGYETDTNKFKIGDGTNHWADLNYFVDGAELSNIIDGAPALLDTLNELAAAIGDDPNFITTVATNLSNHESDTTNIHGIANTADLATQSYVDTAVENIDLSTKQDVVSGVSSTEIGYLDGVSSNIQDQLDDKPSSADFAAHTLDTTSVHGIADTSLLVTTTGTQTLSNKTLSNPTITSGGGYEVVGTLSGFELATYPTGPTTTGINFYKMPFVNSINIQVGDLIQVYKSGETEINSKVWTVVFIDAANGYMDATLNETYSYNNDGYGNYGFDVKKLTYSSVTVSATEISYLDGVTSNIQTQLDAKLASADAYTDSDAVDAISAKLKSGGGIVYQGVGINPAEFFIDTDVIATKAYADGIASGLDIKSSVQVASTANIENLSTFDYSMTAIDGVYLNPGERVLLKNQTSPSENGIFIAQTPSGLVRPTDATFDSSTGAGTLTKGSFTFVEHGTHAGHGFVVSELSVSLGVWYNNWTQFSDSAAYITSVGDNLAVVNGLLSLGTDVVITDSTQTLSNKTLENPTLTLSYDVEGLPVSFTVDAEELSHLNGVTSPIQTQLDDKAPLDSPTFTGTVDLTGATVTGLPEAGPTAVEIIMGVY